MGDRRKKKFHGVFDGGAFVREERGMVFQRRIVGLAHWCPGCKKPHVLHKGAFEFEGEPDTPTVRPRAVFPIIIDNATGHRMQKFHCVYTITNGRISFGRECTHALAGQEVAMVDWKVEDARAPEIPPVYS